MIQVRKLTVNPATGRTTRACGGCAKNATVQVVGFAVVGDRPSCESIDLCDDCRKTVRKRLGTVTRTTRKKEK